MILPDQQFMIRFLSQIRVHRRLISVRLLLDFQIREEERNAEENRLDADEIRIAFRQAQLMFRSGELPQMEQIINLYLDGVNVYPEYVEIHINNVPTSIVNTVKRKKEPAISGLHTFSIERIDENIISKGRTM